LKPQNWLIKIAHNVARSRYARISRRVKEVPLEEHVDQLAIPEEEKPNVEGVLRALGRLPFNQRAALVMRELEGRSYTEIADTLGVSVAAGRGCSVSVSLGLGSRRGRHVRGACAGVLRKPDGGRHPDDADRHPDDADGGRDSGSDGRLGGGSAAGERAPGA